MLDGRVTQISMSSNHGNDYKLKADREELWRYRLCMDRQLTERNPRVELFMQRYLAWYQAQDDKVEMAHAGTKSR